MWYWWVLAAVVVVFLLVAARARQVKRLRANPPPLPPKPSAELFRPVPVDVQRRAKELIDRGKLVQAAQEVREGTGYGLKATRDIVDALQAGWEVPVGGGGPAVAVPGQENLATRARNLVGIGRGDDAVALVRRETGMSLADAESFVTAL